jgi:hypothetical protein
MAVTDMQLIRKRVFHHPLVEKGLATPTDRKLALVSLLLWIGAITAGRLMAYVGAGAAEHDIAAAIGLR